MLNRRESISLLAGLLVATRAPSISAADLSFLPRCRAILDNDYSGDPDDLFQTAHHLLSPSVDVRLVVGSHLHQPEAWDSSADQSATAVAKVGELLEVLGMRQRITVVAGSSRALTSTEKPQRTPTIEAIVREALREDSPLPLFYAAGAGLTDLASAWLLEPRIAERLKLVWIGGEEYAGTPRPPGPREAEYNLTIDTRAAQVIFNESNIDIWQVPRSTYRQMLVSYAELHDRLGRAGALGRYLLGNIERVYRMAQPHGANFGETYVLGDSPLVTLTALQSTFQPDPSSSTYEMRPRPTIGPDGAYGKPTKGRPVRVYTHIDTRLTFEDMYAKFAAFAV